MTTSETVRLGTIESRITLIKIAAVGLIVANMAGLFFSVSLYLDLHATLTARSGIELLQQVRDDYAAYEITESEARDNMGIVRRMESTLDLDVSEEQIINFADHLVESERSYQVFFRLLKVNMYHLTDQIPGSTSWYEIWSPELDAAIERSRSRQLQLLQIMQFYESRSQAQV